MNLPKVKFNYIPVNLELKMMADFLFEDEWGWGDWIIMKHPRLEEVEKIKNKKEKIKFLKNYILNFSKNNPEIFLNSKGRYLKYWQPIEKKYFLLLSQIIETNWPKSRKNITALISLNPICPRWLDTWTFSIFYNYKKRSQVLELIMHEACHFLYFKKWKEIYPKCSPKKYESPHLEWHLSEILAPVILNDKRVQALLKQKAMFYEEHSKIKIGSKTAPEYFTDLYNKHLKNKTSFEEFIKEAYEEMKENKELFKI